MTTINFTHFQIYSQTMVVVSQSSVESMSRGFTLGSYIALHRPVDHQLYNVDYFTSFLEPLGGDSHLKYYFKIYRRTECMISLFVVLKIKYYIVP